MKHVVNTQQVAHLWSHWKEGAVQTHARNGSPGSFFFTDSSIFSYSNHFKVAQHMEHEGKPYIALTVRRNGVTTAKHIRFVEQACSHLQVFPCLNLSHHDVLATYKNAREKALLSAARAKLEWWQNYNLQDARSVSSAANAYIDFFGLPDAKYDLEVSPELLAALKANAREQSTAQAAISKIRNAKLREAQKQQKAQLLIDYAEKLKQWLAGENVSLSHFPTAPVIYMRIEADEVVTTRGARFPITHAKRLFPLIQRCAQNGTAWHSNGHTEHLGSFKVNAIAADGIVTAGCHTVGYDEICRIAKLIGALPCTE